MTLPYEFIVENQLITHDQANHAVMAIFGKGHHIDCLTGLHQPLQGIAGIFSTRLIQFGGINAIKADCQIPMRRTMRSDQDGVAVMHTSDYPFPCLCIF